MLKNYRYIAFYKPYGVLCQFTGESDDRTLSEFGLPSEVYAVGRLDKDSEGLLFLTNDGAFNHKVASPKFNKLKTYLVQVERVPIESDLDKLRKGVLIKGGMTKPAKVHLLGDLDIPERNPPIRFRKSVPTCWLELKISEGKNRQVRRMTAAIGHPTLRLIRTHIASLSLDSLKEGEWRDVTKEEVFRL